MKRPPREIMPRSLPKPLPRQACACPCACTTQTPVALCVRCATDWHQQEIAALLEAERP